jgi:hypothetical protein
MAEITDQKMKITKIENLGFMSPFNLSLSHHFWFLSLSVKNVAALQFFRHLPVLSTNLGIFPHFPSLKGEDFFSSLFEREVGRDFRIGFCIGEKA